MSNCQKEAKHHPEVIFILFNLDQLNAAIDQIDLSRISNHQQLKTQLDDQIQHQKSQYLHNFYQTFPINYVIADPQTKTDQLWNQYAGILSSLDLLKDRHQIFPTSALEQYYDLTPNSLFLWYHRKNQPSIKIILKIVNQDHLDLDQFCNGKLVYHQDPYQLNYFNDNLKHYQNSFKLTDRKMAKMLQVQSSRYHAILKQNGYLQIRPLLRMIEQLRVDLNFLYSQPSPNYGKEI